MGNDAAVASGKRMPVRRVGGRAVAVRVTNDGDAGGYGAGSYHNVSVAGAGPINWI